MTLPSACTDHCPQCLATLRDDEFGVDHDGYLVCLHLCSRTAIERAAQPLPRETPHVYTLTIDCERCGAETPVKSSSQRYCVGCATTVRRERGLSYYRERKRSA